MTTLTQARLKDLLHYDPETGIFTWLRTAPGRKLDLLAGCIDKRSGYVVIGIDLKNYGAHRLAWLYVHGAWPENEVDHRDHDRANNRLLNLRPATGSQNQGNSRRPKNNTSGFKGVRVDPRTGKFRAQIWQGGSRHLGCFDNAEDAHDAYRRAAEQQFGEFANP